MLECFILKLTNIAKLKTALMKIRDDLPEEFTEIKITET